MVLALERERERDRGKAICSVEEEVVWYAVLRVDDGIHAIALFQDAPWWSSTERRRFSLWLFPHQTASACPPVSHARFRSYNLLKFSVFSEGDVERESVWVIHGECVWYRPMAMTRSKCLCWFWLWGDVLAVINWSQRSTVRWIMSERERHWDR